MIAFASRTGNVRYIVSKLSAEHIEISDDLIVDTPYLLITYTDGFGTIPGKVSNFLEKNASLCKGVVVSGNTNFGNTAYGAAGDKIAEMYQIPLIRKLDMRGNTQDYAAIQNYYEKRVIS